MNYETSLYNDFLPEIETAEAVETAAAVQKNVMGSTPIDQLPLAMSYVPMQMWNGTYDGCKALQQGTIFPELDLPFCGRRVK